MNNKKVVALGELLIDFTENGISEQGNPLLEANPGGAPCNVLAMLAKLGVSTTFIGKVGKDHFGKMLKEKVSNLGICTDFLYEDEEVHTTLAFVHNDADGDRTFTFYRNPGADMMLSEMEVDEKELLSADIFHFGTVSMTHSSVRAATKKAVETAKKAGKIISFDPNIREPLWDNLETAREQVAYGLSNCNILKISDNEVLWFSGKDNYEDAIELIQKKYHVPLIVLSLGKEGSRAYYKDFMIEANPFLQQNTIETTGAGDTFGACILWYVLSNGLDMLTPDQLHEMLMFANAAASIITTKKGALCVMPEYEEIETLLKERR